MLSGPARFEVAVPDREEVEQFYQQVLQLELLEKDERSTVFQLPGLQIGFFEAELEEAPVVEGLHFVLEVDDVEPLKAAIEENGGRASGPLKGGGGQRTIFFRDPAGILYKSTDCRGGDSIRTEKPEQTEEAEEAAVPSPVRTSGNVVVVDAPRPRVSASPYGEAGRKAPEPTVPPRDISHREALTFLQAFEADLRATLSLMQAVGRHTPPGETAQARYEELYDRLRVGYRIMRDLGVRMENGNPWTRLVAFHHYMEKALPTERSRSQYLDELYQSPLEQLEYYAGMLQRGITPGSAFRNTFVSLDYGE